MLFSNFPHKNCGERGETTSPILTYSNLSFFFFLLLPLWSIGLISKFLHHFTDGRTPWTGDQLVERRLLIHRTTQTQKNAHTYTHQTSMSWVGFEPTITATEQPKTVHALDRSAPVISLLYITFVKSYCHCKSVWRRARIPPPWPCESHEATKWG
jgi:hypothetical protein